MPAEEIYAQDERLRIENADGTRTLIELIRFYKKTK